MAKWKCVLELDSERKVIAGNPEDLRSAIGRGADLRIYTEFIYNEHIDTNSDNGELVQEVSDFRVTYLLEQRWVAGIMNLRMPIQPPEGFGPRASMSFFLYNENGQQAIARPYLDGGIARGVPGESHVEEHEYMPKYHGQSSFDASTSAPSSNFIYDFEDFRFWVRDDWEEVFAHAADGTVVGGSVDALAEAFLAGRELKVGIGGLCADVGPNPSRTPHELFVHLGPGYYNSERKIFSAGTQPMVRVKPAIPMLYESRGWDFGWLMPRSDGFAARWLCDPYSLEFKKSEGRYPIRWFAR